MSFGEPYEPPHIGGSPYPQPQSGPAYAYPQAAYGYAQGQPVFGGNTGYGSPPKYANWFHRAFATIVDGLFFAVPLFVSLWGRLTFTDAVFYLGMILFLALGIFQWIREGLTGQTLGKAVLRIRLVREFDGRPIGVWMDLGRRVAHFLDSLCLYLGYLWPLWDSKRQTFADKLCNTIVISVD